MDIAYRKEDRNGTVRTQVWTERKQKRGGNKKVGKGA